MGETVRNLCTSEFSAEAEHLHRCDWYADHLPLDHHCHCGHRWPDDLAGTIPLIIHPQGEPMTTPRSCSNAWRHEPHDWSAGFKGEQDHFHCPGVADTYRDNDPAVAHDPFTTVEGLSGYVDQLRDAIDQHAARRARDNERHIRQMTELGEQLIRDNERINKTQSDLSALARRVDELEDDTPDDEDDDPTIERLTDYASSNPFEILEAYRQGQRDAYRNATAIVTNVRYLGPAGGTVEEHTVRILNGVRDNLRDTFIDLAEEPS